MWRSRIFFVGFLALLVLAQLSALPPQIVGEDSRDALISGQIIKIRSLEALVEHQESLISEREAAIAQKEREIESLQASLDQVAAGSTGLVTDSQELLRQLEKSKTESEMLRRQLEESRSELNALKALLTEAQEIIVEEPDPVSMLGGYLGAGVIFDTAMVLEVEAGLLYGSFGLSAGILSDIDADMYLPSEWRYKVGMKMFF